MKKFFKFLFSFLTINVFSLNIASCNEQSGFDLNTINFENIFTFSNLPTLEQENVFFNSITTFINSKLKLQYKKGFLNLNNILEIELKINNITYQNHDLNMLAITFSNHQLLNLKIYSLLKNPIFMQTKAKPFSKNYQCQLKRGLNA